MTEKWSRGRLGHRGTKTLPVCVRAPPSIPPSPSKPLPSGDANPVTGGDHGGYPIDSGELTPSRYASDAISARALFPTAPT